MASKWANKNISIDLSFQETQKCWKHSTYLQEVWFFYSFFNQGQTIEIFFFRYTKKYQSQSYILFSHYISFVSNLNLKCVNLQDWSHIYKIMSSIELIFTLLKVSINWEKKKKKPSQIAKPSLKSLTERLCTKSKTS